MGGKKLFSFDSLDHANPGVAERSPKSSFGCTVLG
jgi:hypothetical protein